MAQKCSEVKNGVKGIGLGDFEIFVNGQKVDTAQGVDYLSAMALYQEWKETLEANSEVRQYIDTPLDEIPQDYWKNSHCPPLQLDDPIPFMGEPAVTEEWSDDYGLEAVV